MSAVRVETVPRTLEVLLAREARRIVYRDRATGQDLVVSPLSGAFPSGLLPAFVVAGEAVWREATGMVSRSTSSAIDRPCSAIGCRGSGRVTSRR